MAKSRVQLEEGCDVQACLIRGRPQVSAVYQVPQIRDRPLVMGFAIPCVRLNGRVGVAIAELGGTISPEGVMEVTHFHLGPRDGPVRVIAQTDSKDLTTMFRSREVQVLLAGANVLHPKALLGEV